MRWSQPLLWLCAALPAVAQSTEGIEDLVKRRMPNHVDNFHFTLVDANATTSDSHDSYIVSSAPDGKIQVQGNSLSALSSGSVSPNPAFEQY